MKMGPKVSLRTVPAYYLYLIFFWSVSVAGRQSRIVLNDSAIPQKIINENCVCVYHYLCGRDYFFITNGSGLLDERIGTGEPPKTSCENPAQICCFIRNGTSIPTYPPLVQETTASPVTTIVPETNTNVAPRTMVPPPTITTTATTTAITRSSGTGSTAYTQHPYYPITIPTSGIIIFLTLPPTQTIPTEPPPTQTIPTGPPPTQTIPTGPPPTVPPSITTPTTAKTTSTTTRTTTQGTANITTTVPPIRFPDEQITTTVTPTTTGAPTTNQPNNGTATPGSRCGLQFTSPEPEMSFEAYTTNFAEFPWMLALLDSTTVSVDGSVIQNAFICGASLITNRVAMTAAHCIKNRTLESLVIRAGEWNTNFANETLPHQDRSIEKIVAHENFDKGTLYNDIALLKLTEPVVYAANVAPICLPRQDEKFVGCAAIATGWGRNSFGPTGKFQVKMRKVTLPIISNALCQSLMRNNTRLGIGFNLHESFVCAGGEENLDTCTGDGGGPLVCKTDESDAFTQVGITSWGIGCGSNNVPGVYADVAYISAWIETQLYELQRDAVPK